MRSFRVGVERGRGTGVNLYSRVKNLGLLGWHACQVGFLPSWQAPSYSCLSFFLSLRFRGTSLPESALHTDSRWFLVLVRSSSSSSKALHSQELARCGNIVQFIGL